MHSNKQFEKFVGVFNAFAYSSQGKDETSETSEVLTFFQITEVIFVKDMLYAVLALIAALVAAGSFYFFQHSDGNTLLLVIAVITIILAMIFGILFLSGRVNKSDDIHITE